MKFRCQKTLTLIGLAAFLSLSSGPLVRAGDIPVPAESTGKKAIISVSGTVSDMDGEPVIGATIVEKGSNNFAVSDVDGKYTIKVAGNSVLVVSYVGYKPNEVKVNGRSNLNITMTGSQNYLNELVVVGYGSMKKRDLSGAVGQIKSSELMSGNPTDLAHGLQGKVAGVDVSQNDGAPGGGMSITVRGANSFSSNTQPLYIVDGVPFTTGGDPSRSETNDGNNASNPLALINPHDIESIEILKDASATAIYGSRGANGVVLITTKRGQNTGYEQVVVSTNFSFSRIANKVSSLDPYRYALYRNEQLENGAKYSNRPYSELAFPGVWHYKEDSDGNIISGEYSPSPEDFLKPGWYTDENGYSTWVGGSDWQDLIYQTGFSQEYNVSVSGGSEKGWHSFSGNFMDQKGIIKESGYRRYSLRAAMGRKITSWLDMGTNLNFTHADTKFSRTNSNEFGVIRSSLIFPPNYDPLHMDEVPEEQYDWLASNPYAYISNSHDNMKTINFFSSSYLEVTLFPFLKFRENLGISYSSNNRGTYYGRETQEGSARGGINGRGSQADNWYSSVTSESLLTFDKEFGKHKVNAVAGFTVEDINSGSKSMAATNFPNDMTQYYDMSLGLKPSPLQSDRSSASLMSFLGRVNYLFDSRYIFTFSYRADGSSKFTDKNKWAHFFSGAFAWRVIDEKFMRNIDIFSDLKLRLSYGETGNQSIGSYRTLSMLAGAQYPFGGNLSSGFANVEWRGPVSGDLRWETTRQFNAGIDIGLCNNRFTLTVDYYYKKTRDLLQDVNIAPSNGFERKMINSANVTNQGLEISAGAFILPSTPVKWNLRANVSLNRNKVGGLNGDQFATRLWFAADQVFIQRNDMPIGAIYGYVEDGYYDNLAEVMSDPDPAVRKKGKSMIGEIKYRDMDGKPGITESDRTIIGNTNPDFIFGLTNNLEWRNFTLSVFFQGSVGNDVFNGNLLDVSMSEIQNIPTFAYEGRWTSENAQNAKWPKAVSGYERDMKISNRYVEDVSYLRLKNITLGYDWNKPFKGVRKINFFVSASNLFTITKYSWFDPEVNAFGTDASRRGVDCYSYPGSRSFSFGFNVTI